MFSLSLLVSTIGSCYAFSEQVPDFVTKQIDCIYSSDFNYDIINNNGVSIKAITKLFIIILLIMN